MSTEEALDLAAAKRRIKQLELGACLGRVNQSAGDHLLHVEEVLPVVTLCLRECLGNRIEVVERDLALPVNAG